jgi:hypothetical protein
VLPLLAILAVVAANASQSAPAGAQGEGGAAQSQTTGATPTAVGGIVEAIRLTEGASGQGGSGTGGGTPQPLPCFSSVVNADVARRLLLDPSVVRDGEQWVSVTCYSPGSDVSWLAAVYRVGDQAGIPSLLEQAIDRLVVPEPVADLHPDATAPHLVGLPEYLAVSADTWQPWSATAAIPGLGVTLTAEPLETQWDMGNGETVTCAGPGSPWQPDVATDTACTYTYRWSSTATQPDGVYHVTASTIWSRTWQCQPACGSGSLPDLTRSTSLDLTVLQGQAVITRPTNAG